MRQEDLQLVHGMTNTRLAREIGVTRTTLRKWPERYPSLVAKLQLAYGLEQGKAITRDQYVESQALLELMRKHDCTLGQITQQIIDNSIMRDSYTLLKGKMGLEWDKLVSVDRARV